MEKNEEIKERMENTIKNLIKNLDTCSEAEVPFYHNQIRRAQKYYRNFCKNNLVK
jgi:hypothetical protein